jgi:hypothetical protein
MVDSGNRSSFVANDSADTHCLQACYQMVVASQTGTHLTEKEAEDDTGWRSDRLSWQFALLLSLSRKHGLYVLDFEDFDPYEFAADPVASLRSQIGDEEAVQQQLEHSDIELEARRAAECLNDARIEFRQGLPSLAHLAGACAKGASVIVLLNGATLLGLPGYRPHFVIVRSVSEGAVRLHDPGPPPRADWALDPDLFLAAWLDPTPTVANLIACSGDPAALR